MNTTFSFDRLVLLLKRYFIENKNKELMYWGVLTLVFAIAHQVDTAKMIIYIMGFIFAAKQFKIFAYTPGGMHYLLIPATHLEKLITTILLSTVYFFIMALLSYSIGNILGTNVGNILFGLSSPVSWDLFSFSNIHASINHIHFTQVNPFIEMTLTFLTIQSVFLLGSVYFKRSSAGRIMLSIFAIFMVLGIVELILLKVLFGTTSLNSNMISFSTISENSPTLIALKYLYEVLSYLFIPFLWIVTFFRLKEKQV